MSIQIHVNWRLVAISLLIALLAGSIYAVGSPSQHITSALQGTLVNMDSSITSTTLSGTWSLTEVVSTNSTEDSRVPSLAVGLNGVVHIAWSDYTNYGGSGTDWDIFYKRWVPSLGWGVTEVVSSESTGYVSDPSLAVGVDGAVHIAWRDFTDFGGSGTDGDIFYKRWVPSSGWTTTEVVSTDSTSFAEDPSMAVGVDGVVHIAWSDSTDYGGAGTGFDIFSKRWVPEIGWTTTEVISTDSTSASHGSSITIGVDGVVHLAWYDSTDYGGAGTDQDIFYKRWTSSYGWGVTEVISSESTGSSEHPTIAVGDDGIVHIAWHDTMDYDGSGTDYDIFYKQWTSGYSSNMTKVVSTESTSGSFNPTMAVGPDSIVHIAWYDLTDYGGAGTDQDIFYKLKLTTQTNAAMVVRGSDNGIYYRLNLGETWEPWQKLPGSTPHAPAAVKDGQGNRLLITVTGSDDQLYKGYLDLDTEAFSGWEHFDGSSPSNPWITAWE